MQTSAAASDTERIGDVLDRAADLTTRYLTDRADLSAAAAFVLLRLSRDGAIRLTALAALEGVSQPAMTQLIQRLERQGLLTRGADPDDGRVALVEISPAGQELLDNRTRLRRARLAALTATLSPEDQAALVYSARLAMPVLDKLIGNAEPAGGGK